MKETLKGLLGILVLLAILATIVFTGIFGFFVLLVLGIVWTNISDRKKPIPEKVLFVPKEWDKDITRNS